MKFVVRMDDISPNMDYAKFFKAYDLLKAKGAFPLLGIVPDNKDPNLNCVSDDEAIAVLSAKDYLDDRAVDDDSESEVGLKAEPGSVFESGEDKFFWDFVKRLEAEGCVLALHGYNHIYSTQKGGQFPLNLFSEFAGETYEEQKRKLSEGLKLLGENNIHPEVFMAPAHSYDSNTLRALKELGITSITDGFGKYPYSYKGMTYYPIASNLKKQLAKGQNKDGIITCVLHVNTMSEADFERTNKWFDEYEVLPYKDFMKLIPKSRNVCGRILEWCMAVGKREIITLLNKRL